SNPCVSNGYRDPSVALDGGMSFWGLLPGAQGSATGSHIEAPRYEEIRPNLTRTAILEWGLTESPSGRDSSQTGFLSRRRIGLRSQRLELKAWSASGTDSPPIPSRESQPRGREYHQAS